MTGAIVGVAFLDRCMFAPASNISSKYLLGELVGDPILLNKLNLGVLILNLFNIDPNHHFHLFHPPKYFLVVSLTFVYWFPGRSYCTPMSEFFSASPTVKFPLCSGWIC